MGQEIHNKQFSPEDFHAFAERLREETELLSTWMREGALADGVNRGGFELEAWLVDGEGRPRADNAGFLERFGNPLAVPELARFNVEFNGDPLVLEDDALSRMYTGLSQTWRDAVSVAEDMDMHLGMIGILPTVERTDLCLANISPLQRYRALNEQVFRLRQERPIRLEIDGRELLRLEHRDVMLESAATSFQVHLQLDRRHAVRLFNAAKILSAPLVAAAANSPYLFGRDLWDETRIPLFEQAVEVGASDLTKRVSFGLRYAEHSLAEVFEANRLRYPVLLPVVMDEPPEKLAHLRLHNGTIWRWNRPLVGFESDGMPHLRLEHRVIPAGPTVADAVANAAFFFGLVQGLAQMETPPEQRLPFERAKDNFYRCARHGLEASVHWLDGQMGNVAELCVQELLPLAQEGLWTLGLDAEESDRWLGIIRRRVETGRTGAAWQRAWVDAHGRDLSALTLAYLERQAEGKPVHRWSL